MKFTKQEQSLIKLAAAHMAPQMTKKATLQDKLAEYGIGMSKKAADLPDYMNALNPLTGFPGASAGAQAGARLASRYAPYVPGVATGDIAKAAPTKTAPAPTTAVQGSGAAGSFAKGNIANLIRQMSQKANARSAAAAQAGAAVGSALAGGKKTQTQLPANPPGASELPKKPMIGTPVPGNVGIQGGINYGDLRREYPYAYQRWLNSPDTRDENGATAIGNVRLFDNYLTRELRGDGTGNGVFDQGAVDRAREAQARSLARDVTAPGTNQYNDAVRMLIQAGRNNQEAFENTGKTPADTTQTGGGGIPTNYTGPNRLNEEQLRQLWNYFPAMGATGNARRFSNLS